MGSRLQPAAGSGEGPFGDRCGGGVLAGEVFFVVSLFVSPSE